VTNVDPELNVVVLEVVEDGKCRKLVGRGPTRDDRCVEAITLAILKAGAVTPDVVRRLYSEWEPTASDTSFLARTFPSAQLTYSFPRPSAGDWPRAFARARAIIGDAVEREHPPESGHYVELPIPSASKRWWQFWR
jgi:hypothetical protein